MKKREIVILFDVKNGNPNGDPDNGNCPRFDGETKNGLTTDVCLKRKIRNYVEIVKESQPPFEIYVKDRAVKNDQHKKAYEALDLEIQPAKAPNMEIVHQATHWLCQNFYDIRTFGAVMTNEINGGQVNGPVQITYSESIDPISPICHTITSIAVTNEADRKKGHTMGTKHIVPYGLYMAKVYISACLAEKTRFSEEDYDLFLEALTNMFEHDRSAARGEMAVRKMFIFEHESKYGNAPAHLLFDLISVEKKEGVEYPRSFKDYNVSINKKGLPKGVELREIY